VSLIVENPLEIRCSIQLSYDPVIPTVYTIRGLPEIPLCGPAGRVVRGPKCDNFKQFSKTSPSELPVLF
jgi:hypothetical protein